LPTLPPPADKPASKEPERQYSALTDGMVIVLTLAVVVLIVACSVGVVAKDLRDTTSLILFYAAAVGVEALVVIGAGAFVRAWAGRGRSWVVRLAVLTLAAATVLLHPAGVALIVRSDTYVPGVFLSLAALAIAAATGIPAARRHPIYPSTTAQEPQRHYSNLTGCMIVVLIAAGIVLIATCAVGVFATGSRDSASTTALYTVAVAIEALVVIGAGAFVRAWAGRGRSWVVRLAVLSLAVATVLLHPAGVALIVRSDTYVPGVFLSLAALAIAAATGIPAALRHPIYAADTNAKATG
jgi:hypothetical protein